MLTYTVPYFMVANENVDLNSDNPTLLYGYGGFEISLTPGYRAGGSGDGIYDKVRLQDINGDGLPDRLLADSSNNRMKVQLNTGSGFEDSEFKYWMNGGKISYFDYIEGL